VVENLARFKPTKVAAERPSARASEQYPAYLNGTLAVPPTCLTAGPAM
jgi:hypothetical protein